MIPKAVVAEYVKNNLNVLGVTNKMPSSGSWKHLQTEMITPQELKGEGVGIICGKISGNLEVLDIDLKYDISGTLYNRLKQKINDVNSELIKSLMIIQTPSGGYHWLYRCPSGIEGSLKLAERDATEDERGDKETVKVLIETRGEASYIASLPHDGYNVKQGRFSQIPSISAEDRKLIFSSSRELDERIQEFKIPTDSLKNTFNIHDKDSTRLTTWDDYDKRGSIPDDLAKAGWIRVREDSERIYYKRAGKTDAKSSGNYWKTGNFFKSFSTSTVLEAGKGYKPFALYYMLLHNEDATAAARQLYGEGFGDRLDNKKESILEYAEEKYGDKEDSKTVDEYSISKYLSNYENDYAYLQSVRDGNVEKGLSTGSDLIDKHFLFKKGSFIISIGHTSVGKTLSALFLTVLSALKHDWKIIVLGMENSSGMLKRQILELYLQKPLTQTTAEEFSEGNKWLNDHYVFIAARGGHVRTITDAIKLCYKMLDEDHYDMIVLDPYSGFDSNRKGGESEHEANKRNCGDLLNFSTKTNCVVLLSLHTNSSARREIDPNTGNLRPPRMSDVDGGGLFSNRCDTAICFHRLINAEDPLERITTSMYVEKERHLESGGSLTSRENPIQIQFRDSRFYVNGYEDVVYNIKNKHKEKFRDLKTNEVIEFEDVPF